MANYTYVTPTTLSDTAYIDVVAPEPPPDLTVSVSDSILVVDNGVAPVPGAINLSIANTEWESARAAHVWMKPQRVNMVANPSFEVDAAGLFYRSNAYRLADFAGNESGSTSFTLDLNDALVGTGVIGGGTISYPDPDPAINLWILVFNAAATGLRTFSPTDGSPGSGGLISLKNVGWYVGLSTIRPTTLDLTCDLPVGAWNATLYGVSHVDLTVPGVNDRYIGLGATSSFDNAAGGTAVVSNPTNPTLNGGLGEHLGNRQVVQIAGRWLPGSATNYDVRFNDLPWTVSPLPDPTTSGNEYKVTEIAVLEFISAPSKQPFGWRTNGEIETVHSGSSGVPGPTPSGPYPRSKAAHITGGTSVINGYSNLPENQIVLESNLFPTFVSQDRLFSVEAQVAGHGYVRIGMVFWDMAKLTPEYVAGDWEEVNSDTALSTIRAMIPEKDLSEEAQFRLEFAGDEVWVDNVMVDNNGAQLGYFDGDWFTGVDGDFSWYGAWGRNGAVNYDAIGDKQLINLRNRSYSLFYNDRKNQDAWLFGYTEDVAKDGKVYSLFPYAAVEGGGPPDSLWIDENRSIAQARELLINSGIANGKIGVTQLILDGGDIPVPTLVGELDLISLSTVQRVGGEAWKWVPEGAEVIPQWDFVYATKLSCWPGELFIPVKDVSATPVNTL